MRSSSPEQKELWWGYCKMTAIGAVAVGTLMLAPPVYGMLIGSLDGGQELAGLVALITPWLAGFITLYNGWVGFYLSKFIGTDALSPTWWATIVALVAGLSVLAGMASYWLIGLLAPSGLILGLVLHPRSDS